MKRRTSRQSISISAAAVVFLFCVGLPALAQVPPSASVQVTTPFSAFTADGSEVTIDDVAGGRRFRGRPGASVIVYGRLRLPAPSVGEPKMQGLYVHFYTSESGPSLRGVELRDGRLVTLHVDTNLAGDYRTIGGVAPNAPNAWQWRSVPVPVSERSYIRLVIQFPIGFDSPINPGEFVLAGVSADFPRKRLTLPKPSTEVPMVTDQRRAGTGDAPKMVTDQRRVGTAGTPEVTLPGTMPARARLSPGVIYAVGGSNELLWYDHSGRDEGTMSWAAPTGKQVGTGWAFKQIFSGDDGVIYAITEQGDLRWYRHDGHTDGSMRWAASQGRKVGEGWTFPQVFSGGAGVIYAVTPDGELLWYRHDGRAEGTMQWAAMQGKQVGTGWAFKHLFSSGDGVIYAVTQADELLWYRHDGRADGTPRWAAAQGKNVGTGWNFKTILPGGRLGS
jgi:hypothetical protein